MNHSSAAHTSHQAVSNSTALSHRRRLIDFGRIGERVVFGLPAKLFVLFKPLLLLVSELLLLIAGSTQKELARRVRYLKIENEVYPVNDAVFCAAL